MLKIVVIFSVMFIGALYASCDSCGDECVATCGSRRFRACCYNYLRKKRGPDTKEFWISSSFNEENMPAGVFLMYKPNRSYHQSTKDMTDKQNFNSNNEI